MRVTVWFLCTDRPERLPGEAWAPRPCPARNPGLLRAAQMVPMQAGQEPYLGNPGVVGSTQQTGCHLAWWSSAILFTAPLPPRSCRRGAWRTRTVFPSVSSSLGPSGGLVPLSRVNEGAGISYPAGNQLPGPCLGPISKVKRPDVTSPVSTVVRSGPCGLGRVQRGGGALGKDSPCPGSESSPPPRPVDRVV